MDEASPSLQQAQLRANMNRAVMILARRRAIKETKRQLAARGLKLANYSHREIVAMAEAQLLADVQHRAEIIAGAKAIVDAWHAEGYFKQRRARLNTCAQNSKA
jgi:hypothetical protein